ncbi:MAG TPA: VTT domain-containing protein [Rhizomicrobium sp.]|nr:VTT domain-containing protein [Rhizomicrobium sp.]
MTLKSASRLVALLAVAAGIVLAVVYRHAIDPAAIRNAIAAHPLSPALFIALQVAASLLFVPRTVLGVAAGLLFGLYWGAVWALVGALAGAAAGFALVRWFGIGGVLDTSPGIGQLIARAEHGGWRAVAIVRLTPLPHSLGNTLLAMTNLKWRDYLLGSLAGMAPMTLAQVDVGASGGEMLKGGQWVLGCLMLALGLAATFLLRRVARRQGSQSRPRGLD